ncbi:pilus subunit protein PilA [Janthinobacterium sp. Marseille]|nr:Flp family type IVb pilin [Janthinobacterium sp. Marseille]ABR91806.1 pilus subunit protein PilA [Janthinobacterium sp. Marseille]
MKNQIIRFMKDEEGATAIEYGLIVGLISVVIAVSVGLIGGNLQTLFTNISNALATAVGS